MNVIHVQGFRIEGAIIGQLDYAGKRLGAGIFSFEWIDRPRRARFGKDDFYVETVEYDPEVHGEPARPGQQREYLKGYILASDEEIRELQSLNAAIIDPRKTNEGSVNV